MADNEVYDYKKAVLKDMEDFVQNPDNINLDFFRDKRGIVCRSVAADFVYAKGCSLDSVVGVCKNSEEAHRNLLGNERLLAKAMKESDGQLEYWQSAEMILNPEKADRLIREYLAYEVAPKALDNVLVELGEPLDREEITDNDINTNRDVSVSNSLDKFTEAVKGQVRNCSCSPEETDRSL